jgi:uncharacterized protein (UPF0276 family)
VNKAPAPAYNSGIGLRTPHFRAVLSTKPDVGFFEVHSENYFGAGGQPLSMLERVRRDYSISLHGVGLSLGGAEPLNQAHLSKLRALVDRIQPLLVSEHLSWVGIDGVFLNDLLPLPYTEEALSVMAAHVLQVQDQLGRRILIENPSSYLTFRHSTMSEAEFLRALVAMTDCGLLLDVNNIYVSAENRGFDPAAYLSAVPASAVAEYHLAGHTDTGDLLIDTHDHAVSDPVWALYRTAVRMIGDRPTLIERDSNIPPLAELVAEAAQADRLRQSVAKQEAGHVVFA